VSAPGPSKRRRRPQPDGRRHGRTSYTLCRSRTRRVAWWRHGRDLLQPLLVLACIHKSIRFGYFSGIFLLKVLEHFLTAHWFVVFDLSLQRSPRTSYPTSLALTASPSTWISRSAPAPARRRSMIRTTAVSCSDDLARPRLHRGQPPIKSHICSFLTCMSGMTAGRRICLLECCTLSYAVIYDAVMICLFV
jgi:hypothetical protein